MSAESTDRNTGNWEPDNQALEQERALKILAALFKVHSGYAESCDIWETTEKGKHNSNDNLFPEKMENSLGKQNGIESTGNSIAY